MSDEKKGIAAYIIGHLDKNGYITTSIEKIAKNGCISKKDATETLHFLKTLEPKGIFAQSLKECLLLQIPTKDRLARDIVENHLDELSKKNLRHIEKALNTSANKIDDAIARIKLLNLIPAINFQNRIEQIYINPEFQISIVDGELKVGLNSAREIKVFLSDYYLNLYKETVDEEVKLYLKKKIENAQLYKNAVESRKTTMLDIVSFIAEIQKDFFLRKQNHLNALDMKTLANKFELHNSTISRALKNKYVITPRGTFLLKNLLSQSLSNMSYSMDALAKAIFEVIEKEDKAKPLSDEKICKELSEYGFDCKRRTVTKYRQKLKIQSASERKLIKY